MSAEPLFHLAGVAFRYPDGRPVLADVNVDLWPGERVALLGANGAGKSTLLQLMLGLHKATAGTVAAFGAARTTERSFREVRQRAGLLFQDPDDQLFCPTVGEDVAFGPRNLGRSAAEARLLAADALERVGLAGYEDRVPHRLSGGEKRLAALAGVLAMAPEVLLLDEPTAGLDAHAEAKVLALLTGLDQAMIIVSHDRSVVARLAHRSLVLAGGRIGSAGTLPLFVPPFAHGVSS